MPDFTGFRIRIDNSTKEILEAGFYKKAIACGPGESSKDINRESIPVNIMTNWIYNNTTEDIEERQTPIKPKKQREAEEKKQKKKDDYADLTTDAQRIAFIAGILELT